MKEKIKELPKEIKEAFTCIDYELSVCNDELPKILDYITTLQEENKKIRKMNKAKHKYAMNMEDKYITEKAKNQKAIEKINSMFNVFPGFRNGKTIISENLIELLNILQGDDNNE